MRKIITCNKGVTLVEIIVTLVLSVIVMTSVAAVLPRILNLFRYTNTMAERNTMLNNVANPILDDLRSANDIPKQTGSDASSVLTIPTPTGVVKYSIESEDINRGALLRNGDLVFSSEYYNGIGISFELTPVSSTSVSYDLTVTITPQQGRGSMMERTYAVTPLILNQYTPEESVSGQSSNVPP